MTKWVECKQCRGGGCGACLNKGQVPAHPGTGGYYSYKQGDKKPEGFGSSVCSVLMPVGIAVVALGLLVGALKLVA